MNQNEETPFLLQHVRISPLFSFASEIFEVTINLTTTRKLTSRWIILARVTLAIRVVNSSLLITISATIFDTAFAAKHSIHKLFGQIHKQGLSRGSWFSSFDKALWRKTSQERDMIADLAIFAVFLLTFLTWGRTNVFLSRFVMQDDIRKDAVWIMAWYPDVPNEPLNAFIVEQQVLQYHSNGSPLICFHCCWCVQKSFRLLNVQ